MAIETRTSEGKQGPVELRFTVYSGEIVNTDPFDENYRLLNKANFDLVEEGFYLIEGEQRPKDIFRVGEMLLAKIYPSWTKPGFLFVVA